MFNKKSISFLTVVALVIVMFAAQISEALTPETQAPVGKGLTAIDQASKDNKYLFIFFYRGNYHTNEFHARRFQPSDEGCAGTGRIDLRKCR